MSQVKTIIDLQSIQAEEAVLGCAFIDPSALIEIRGVIKSPNEFVSQKHRLIFSAMCKLQDSGQPHDDILLIDEIIRESRPVGIDGNESAFGDMVLFTTVVPTSINATRYAQTVHDWHVRRTLVRAGGEIAATAYDGELPVLEAVGKSMGIMGQVVAGQDDSRYSVTAQDQARSLIDHAETDKDSTNILPYPWESFNRDFGGMDRGESYFFGGVAKSGKTTTTTAITMNWAMSGYNVVRFCLEMPQWKREIRDVAYLSGIPFNTIRRKTWNHREKQLYYEWVGKLSQFRLKTEYFTPATISGIRNALRKRVMETGRLDGVEIDYFQLIRPENGNKSQPAIYFDEIAEGLRSINLEFDCPFILPVQMNGKSISPRDDKRPKADDIYMTNAPVKICAQLWTIYNDELYNPDCSSQPGVIEVTGEVSRDGNHGTRFLRFDGETSRVVEANMEYVSL